MSVDDLNRVTSLINTSSLAVYDDYCRGDQPIAFLSDNVRQELGSRLPHLVLNVPRVVLGSRDERLDVEGFRLARGEEADEALLDIWQGNDLDEWSQLCHIEAMKHGISFVTVWTGDDDAIPRIAVESAHQMAVEYAPGTRTVVAAAKQWEETDDQGRAVVRAVLYLPDVIEHWWRYGSGATDLPSADRRWVFDDVNTVPNPLGEVPVVPFVNRPSLTDLTGESELRDVMPITDGINKLLSDMMVTSEYHAEGRRYATGMQVPREAMSNDRLKAEVKKEWQDAAKGKFLVGGPGVQFGQFAAADLQNFINAVNMLLGKAAFVAGLPPHMLGVATDNPASADAIRSSEASLIRIVRRKMRGFGGSWERVMRLALLVRDGSVDPSTRSMETIWANPETPTFAQDADAITKLVAGDRPILTVRAGRERLGLTPTQIKRMEDDEAKVSANTVTADVAARMAQARDLQARDGMSLPASLAAVGLMAAAGAQAGNAPAAPVAAPSGPSGPTGP